mmetsp:Transcript_47398/g.34688  ORF Transcript_47398/g.34688 Transcript_47398/m.34688 type:complete len:89 (-) Transcript_47398:34-300(-)|eukprot:CAMPEP_0202955914 /NCGR_PEP_ID=MMETSP1396-20130829/432_1 /ASSEMBLY_ACC=CAM_ASM_000872 /TAXON_ID= /ORGANISM="Pseudokeronopsis sp., Strain Brazil" /LENGTH=88 /DNA_ID=CAMNT_0049672677 /DNA_START=690 /DNA_END=956 /DNA_ORIENTATION=+
MSEADYKIAIINAEAQAKAIVIDQNAKTKMIADTISYQGWGFKNADELITFTTRQDLLDYVFYLNVMNLNKKLGAKLLVGLDTPVLNM